MTFRTFRIRCLVLSMILAAAPSGAQAGGGGGGWEIHYLVTRLLNDQKIACEESGPAHVGDAGVDGYLHYTCAGNGKTLRLTEYENARGTMEWADLYSTGRNCNGGGTVGILLTGARDARFAECETRGRRTVCARQLDTGLFGRDWQILVIDDHAKPAESRCGARARQVVHSSRSVATEYAWSLGI